MFTLDDAEKNIRQLFEDVSGRMSSIVTEEDAKIQLIIRILTECLYWPFSSIQAETHHENGYSDYILKSGETPLLLLEAKKIGAINIAVAESSKVKYLKISGSSLKQAIVGIEQAVSYAVPNGFPIAVLTDGNIWIIFKTFVQGENFKSKEAVVFPSLEAVISNFSQFYDLLSKDQFENRIYNTIFDNLHHKRLLLSQKFYAPINESEIKISPKSSLAFDLDAVFSSFFSRLTGDTDDDLLIECFVESRESVIADFALEKMTMNVLGNISPFERNIDSELSKLIQSNIRSGDNLTTSESGETVFIVGPTGAGKTTFLTRFFQKTLPNSVRESCVLVHVNCLDATGREDTALEWITEEIIQGLEQKLYNGSPTWNVLRSLYFGEYKKRSEGVWEALYRNDKEQFKIKFGEYLDNTVEKDREGYLKRILADVVQNRKMLPLLVVDNTDEFTLDFKQRCFQFIQALRRHAKHCLVLFPVTDKSAWSFSKTDVFGIYRSKSFFLPTPSPREVLRKRINFLKQKITEDKKPKKVKKDYFLERGIRISIDDLNGFADVLEDIFVNHDYTAKTLGELTNYNIRRTLALSQRVITSSVIMIDDLIQSYLNGQTAITPFPKFIEALLKGDYELYKQSDSHEIFPIFKVSLEFQQSPLLNLRILALLDSVNADVRSIEERHLTVQSIINYFEAIGSAEVAVDTSLKVLLEAGLIEPFDMSNRSISVDQKLAISYKGKSHLRLASQDAIFFNQMALTTAITDEDCVLKIKTAYRQGIQEAYPIGLINSLFLEYLLAEDKRHLSVSVSTEQYVCQQNLLTKLQGFRSSNIVQSESAWSSTVDYYKEGLVKAVVDFYDNSKGFGFVEVDGLDSKIFIHCSKLRTSGINSLKDGDEILCDISRGDKGMFVETIYSNESATHQLENVRCRIIRLFPERGYGFVQVEDSIRTAFFHISVFSTESRNKIAEGLNLIAEIGPDKKGNGLQIKSILEIIL